jgi:ubiquinone/menaquinone biosynthesis C-methylase UbiE
MDPNSLPLLCDPQTHEVLELQNNALVDVRSGRRYPLRDGIPDFLDNVSGQNKKYQELYDRIAAFYDLSEKLYVWLKHQRNFRRAYLDELEVPSSARVLEVSVGTGANLRYLPSGVALFGLGLSWGMLRRCRKNLQKWRRTAELFHGEAEHLPFRDNVFDVVFHVGGINFFNDEAGAIQEMIRVTKPRTKILIVDETEKVVKEQYEKTPLIGKYFKKRTGVVTDPLLLVPAGMAEVRCKNILEGKAYCLTFRKP